MIGLTTWGADYPRNCNCVNAEEEIKWMFKFMSDVSWRIIGDTIGRRFIGTCYNTSTQWRSCFCIFHVILWTARKSLYLRVPTFHASVVKPTTIFLLEEAKLFMSLKVAMSICIRDDLPVDTGEDCLNDSINIIHMANKTKLLFVCKHVMLCPWLRSPEISAASMFNNPLKISV